MQYINPQDNTAPLQRLGNMAYLVMGMRTEGGRIPYAMTVVANKAAGASFINGNWWQGNPVGKSGYSLGVMQYDFGAFKNQTNTTGFSQQVAAWAKSQNFSLDVGSASNLAAALTLRGGSAGQGLEVASNWISINDRDIVNSYLATDAGQRWVYNNLEVGSFIYNATQTAIIGGNGAVTQAVAGVLPALNTAYFKNLSPVDQQMVEVMLLKEINQGGPSSVALATKWMLGRGNATGTAADYLAARQSALAVSNPELSKGIGAAYTASESILAVQQSPLFSSIWNRAQISSLDAPSIAQDPELLALRAVFAGGASPATISAISNRIPGTFSGDGKNGFIAVDSTGHIVILQSAVSNGVPGGNGGAPATAQGWQLDNTGAWLGFTEGVGRGSRYIIQLIPGSKSTWKVVALNEDGSETPVLALAEGDSAVVSINGTNVSLDANKDGQFAFMETGELIRAEVSADLKVESGEVLTGQYAGNTYTRTWRQGNPALQLGFAADDGIVGSQLDNIVVITDGRGRTTTIDNKPATETVDGVNRVVGYTTRTTVEINGQLQSVIDVKISSDPQTAVRTAVTDTTLYAASGEFSSHTLSTIVETSVGLQTNRLEVEYDRFDQITKTSLTERQPDNTLLTTVRNGVGDTLSSTSLQTFDDSSSIATTTYPGGRVETLATDFEGTPYQSSITVPGSNNGSTTEYYKYVDGKPVLSSRKIVETVTDATGTYTVETIITETGTVRNKYDAEHQLLSSEPVQNGISTLISAINTTGTDVIRNGSPLVDALALVNALRTGQPLPIVSSGLKLANSVNAFNGLTSINLSGASGIVGGLSSLQNLQHALDTGDDFGAIAAGAQTIQFGAQAYAAFASNNIGADAVANTFGADSVISEVSDAVPYLAIANELAQGDYTGAAIAAVSITVPVVGWAYAAFQVFSSFFGRSDPPPEPWGGASANWTGSSLTTNSWGGNGGEATANAYMNQFIAQLDALAAREQAQNPGSPIGVVANRLPSFSYRYRSGFALNEIDPVTGIQRNVEVRYDLTGRPFNAAPGSEVGSQSFAERFIRDALARGAVAPLWEAKTAAMQTQTGDPQAGLTEEERAGRNGVLATKATGTTQHWRPVALDLNGDGIQTTGSSQTVAFDVDDSGFLKNSAWLNGNDGFLVLDRNLNAQLDSGRELFSNGALDISARGLAGLHWVDANYDGVIDANDPVFNELKVWQDANGDGQVQTGESQGLTTLGIGKLNYVMGTFEQNGATKQLASPDLLADTEGSRVNVIPEGIVVQTSQGNVSLLVTHIDDRSLLEANRDGATSFEDIETIITAADLLANDTLAGFSGQNLSLISVSNFTHGTGYLDSNGSIHFRPDANYFGAASFDYQIQASSGQTATATVDLNIQNVNDAPTATVDMTNSVVVASDIDDPTGTFTYSVIQQPQQGAAQIGANGSFTYTNWYAPNTPGVSGDPFSGAVSSNSDPFVVRVSDSHGAFSDVTVNAVHQGMYSPSLGGGGGGGKKPIAIDLNGDGFQFTNVDDSNVFFDVNGDGWKERTSWFSGSDAFLVLDEKGDRNIDQVDEISFAKYKRGAQTDLEGLAAFDTNGDGQLTAADKDWGKFGVWKDANQNGITDAGEFYTLSEQGITAIGLQSDGQFSVVNGQTVHGLGSITRQDGSTLAIADVTLSYSTKDVQLPTAGGVSEIVAHSQYSASGEEIPGTNGNDLILGKSGNNVIQAYGGDDVIFEDGGNDFIDAGEGNDIVYSGADNDVVLAGTGDDVVFAGLGNDLVLGGDGQDALFGEAGNDILFGSDGNDLISGDAGNDLVSGDLGDDSIFGGSGNDALFGMDGNDQLSGDEGNDDINGGTGNDTLDGGTGADTMLGGAGNDIYMVDNVADIVQELTGEGVDLVKASVSYVLLDQFENLSLTGSENIGGVGNDLDNTIVGNAGNNRLVAAAGNDQMDGGIGADVMEGGIGDDTYVVDNAADVVVETANQGLDTVNSSISYHLATNLEKLVGIGNAAITLSGNDAGNTLVANNAGNTLIGGAGADTLTGGTGADTFQAGAGDDTYVLQLGGRRDTVLDSAGTADRILVRGNLSATDLELTRHNRDVIVTIKGTSDALVLQNWFTDTWGQLSPNTIESIQFENGSAAIDAHYIQILLDNRAPTAIADSGTAQEDAIAPATGNVLLNDTDPDLLIDERQHLTVANTGTMNGVYGQLQLNADGSYSYAVNNSLAAVQSLGRNGTLIDTFDYAVQDNAVNNKTATSTLTITIQGTNDGPQAFGDVAQVSEDTAVSATGNVLGNDTDIDTGDILLVATAGVLHGTYGELALQTDGSYRYELKNSQANIQTLHEGQQVVDSFNYTATDGLATSNAMVNVTVTGTNDAPVAFADVGAAQEDATVPTTGNVLSNDVDLDQGTVLQVTNFGTLTGQYGSLTLNTNGSFSYVLNNSMLAVQSLGVGQTVVDQFTYEVKDDGLQPLTASSTLAITITGTNDAPTVAAALVTQAGREKQAFSYTVPVGTFADVDNGDVLTYSALAVNSAGVTQSLPTWLSFNSTTRTFSGTPGSADGGSFDFRVTATDKSGASVSTRFTLDIADEYAGTGANINVITGSWTNDTLNGTSRSETFYGNGGTDRILAGEGNNTVISNGSDTCVSAGTGNDTITTSYGNDTIYAGDGINKVNAGGGNNQVVTGSGDDTISTDWGLSTINAGAGNNTIVATGDATIVTTDAGNDSITTSYGNDTINAGDGNNTINAGGGNNLITAGSGNDVIYTDWGNSTIYAGEGTNTIAANGGNTVVTTGSGADRITTGSGNDTINSGAGNDVISTGWGSDVINTGAGDDVLTTGGGNDTVRAGLGNDTINADQWSDDKFYYARGDGRDTLTDSGGQDTLILENISSDQLWFSHVGNDLNVNVVGSSDGVTIKNWYSGAQYPGAQYHVEQFKTSDGKVLLDSQVQNLVNAMAAFAPPAAGQTNLTGSTATTLAPILAANWH